MYRFLRCIYFFKSGYSMDFLTLRKELIKKDSHKRVMSDNDFKSRYDYTKDGYRKITPDARKINYADEHSASKTQDIWNFKDPPYPIYPTEKNLEMIEFIINASSNSNSIVMDCFCGSGTTLKAAQNCSRQWIGIDSSEVAIKTCKKRLEEKNLFNQEETYRLITI